MIEAQQQRGGKDSPGKRERFEISGGEKEQIDLTWNNKTPPLLSFVILYFFHKTLAHLYFIYSYTNRHTHASFWKRKCNAWPMAAVFIGNPALEVYPL